MKEIPLTQGRVALVDDANYGWLNQWKWCAARASCQYLFYATRNVRTSGHRYYEHMHRAILGLQPGDGKQCDHVDGDGLNNQRSNLRISSQTENMHNRRKLIVGTSKYKGVCWYRRERKWRARIRVNRKLISLGYFASETDAALAYNRAARKHFGDFALLNTP